MSNRYPHVKLHGVEVQFDTMANYYIWGSAGLDFDQSNEEAIESPCEGSMSLDFDKDKLEEIIEEEVLYYGIGAKKAWKKKKKSWRSTSAWPRRACTAGNMLSKK